MVFAVGLGALGPGFALDRREPVRVPAGRSIAPADTDSVARAGLRPPGLPATLAADTTRTDSVAADTAGPGAGGTR